MTPDAWTEALRRTRESGQQWASGVSLESPRLSVVLLERMKSAIASRAVDVGGNPAPPSWVKRRFERQADAEYRNRMLLLPDEDRARLLYGDWACEAPKVQPPAITSGAQESRKIAHFSL